MKTFEEFLEEGISAVAANGKSSDFHHENLLSKLRNSGHKILSHDGSESKVRHSDGTIHTYKTTIVNGIALHKSTKSK